jgi:hypothetical protein
MEYIIVEPIEGYTSQERAAAISAELFSVGRPAGVRNPDDVSSYVFGWIKHPDTETHALTVAAEYQLYVHPERNLDTLLTLFPEVSQAEKDALSHYIDSHVSRRFPFGNIVPTTATLRSHEEMDTLGWFPDTEQ